MNITHAEKRIPAKKGLALCAVTLFIASGCSTIVNQGKYSECNVPGPTRERRIDPWVWGNAAFAVFPPVAIVGLGIDAFSGNWYRYESANSTPTPPLVANPPPVQQPDPPSAQLADAPSAQLADAPSAQQANPQPNPNALSNLLDTMGDK